MNITDLESKNGWTLDVPPHGTLTKVGMVHGYEGMFAMQCPETKVIYPVEGWRVVRLLKGGAEVSG